MIFVCRLYTAYYTPIAGIIGKPICTNTTLIMIIYHIVLILLVHGIYICHIPIKYTYTAYSLYNTLHIYTYRYQLLYNIHNIMYYHNNGPRRRLCTAAGAYIYNFFFMDTDVLVVILTPDYWTYFFFVLWTNNSVRVCSYSTLYYYT